MGNPYEFKLVNPAKNLGGDRYKTTVEKKDWTVYFPQEISRPSGRPVKNITIIIDIEE